MVFNMNRKLNIIFFLFNISIYNNMSAKMKPSAYKSMVLVNKNKTKESDENIKIK